MNLRQFDGVENPVQVREIVFVKSCCSGPCILKCAGVCCGIFVGVLAIILWGVLPYFLGTGIGYDAFIARQDSSVFEYVFRPPGLTPKTIPNHIWWPGCTKVGEKSQEYLMKCAKPCFSPELIPAISKFNEARFQIKATYPSRPDTEGKTYKLEGWLLRGDRSNLPKGVNAPRVVINHGFTSNSNKWYPTLSAYYLRSLGFDVLLNNIRSHGYSQNSTHADVTTWGYSYHYDLLGAWDFLKKDPSGLMGGELPSSKVGIMGFSMGAFVALNAFTLDKNVPAVWADSPPSTPSSVFFFGAEKNPAAPLFKIPGVSALVWHWMSKKAGVDLEARTPLKDIPGGPGEKRPIQLVSNLADETVPASDVKSIVKLLKKYPDKYEMAEPIYTDKKCNNEHHLVTMLLEPKMYRERLCSFWTAALDAPKEICGLDQLPEFEVATSAISI